MNSVDLNPTPWYRQFWPWFLILLPLCTVIAGIGTILIAVMTPNDLVEDDYYKRGLAINQDLERDRQAQALGLVARLSHDPDAGQLSLSLSHTQPISDAPWLQLQLVHPTQAKQDVSLTLARVAPGQYRVPLDRLDEANWHLMLSPPDRSWQLRGRLTTANMDKVQLQ